MRILEACLAISVPIIYRRNGNEEMIGRIVISMHSDPIFYNVAEHLKINALILVVLVMTLIVVTWWACRSTAGRAHLCYVLQRPLGSAGCANRDHSKITIACFAAGQAT